MERCPSCGEECFCGLGRHYRYSPWCEPRPVVPPETGAKRPQTALNLFQHRLRSILSGRFAEAHLNQYVSAVQLSTFLTILVTVVLLIIAHIESESPQSAATCAAVRSLIKSVPSAETLLNEGGKCYERVKPTIFTNSVGPKKSAVFFSVTDLVITLLKENADVRRVVLESSAKWKTGELHNVKPDKYVDSTCGTGFRGRAEVVGKATPEQQNDIRIALSGWTDELTTVDGLGNNARKNKYGVVLFALLNLPLYMRHFADYILMCALYQSQFAKANGGLVRLLTGVEQDGTVHQDGLTLAAELDLGRGKGVPLTLPSDVPGEEPRSYTLRIFLLFFSLDWLAHGDFGPFAGAVSARRPCFKCKWTASCPCAYLPAGTFEGTHTTHCLRRQPHTHAEVMREVQAMREWAGSVTSLKQRRTETGIFHTFAPSMYLLDDVVEDTTVDVMHVFLCGVSRYLLAFLTDIQIPAEYTWGDLNKALSTHKYARSPPPTTPTTLG